MLSVRSSKAVKTNFQAGLIVEYVSMLKGAATDIMSSYFFTRLKEIHGKKTEYKTYILADKYSLLILNNWGYTAITDDLLIVV